MSPALRRPHIIGARKERIHLYQTGPAFEQYELPAAFGVVRHFHPAAGQMPRFVVRKRARDGFEGHWTPSFPLLL